LPGEFRVQVRIFPSNDKHLLRAVQDALADARQAVPDPDPNPEATERELREAVARRLRGLYPRVVIGSQSELGRRGDEPVRWYVYRDGKVRLTNEVRNRLYDRLGEARDTVETSRQILKSTQATLDRSGAQPRRAPPRRTAKTSESPESDS
jgi:hypothetical protein